MNRKHTYGEDGYIDFTKFWDLMAKKNLNKQFLINSGIHRATVYKLVNNDNVTCEVIAKLCRLLKCQPKQIMEYIPPERDADENI